MPRDCRYTPPALFDGSWNQHVSMLRLLHTLSVFSASGREVLGKIRGFGTMILHDFARTLCFHVQFFVVFGLIRYFLVKTRYFHVVFLGSCDSLSSGMKTWEKKQCLRTAPTQNLVFLRSL